MPKETLAKPVRKIRSAEQWAEARRLYEEGLSLEGVAAKLQIPYPTVWYHAWVEGWPVRSRGVPRDPRYQAAKAKQLQRKLAKEEERLAQELVLIKTEDLELLARKSLAADSARAKVAVSRRVTEILSRLDSSVPVRSAAQALGSLAPILRLIYGWSNEPETRSMKLARTSNDANRQSLVNLALINTTLEQLARLALANGQLDQSTIVGGAHLTECNGHEMGPSAIAPEQHCFDSCSASCFALSVGPSAVAPEQPTAATHGPPSSKKEAPKPPTEGQSAQVASAGAPSSPAAQAQAARLKALEQARAEHRRANWEKYRYAK